MKKGLANHNQIPQFCGTKLYFCENTQQTIQCLSTFLFYHFPQFASPPFFVFVFVLVFVFVFVLVCVFACTEKLTRCLHNAAGQSWPRLLPSDCPAATGEILIQENCRPVIVMESKYKYKKTANAENNIYFDQILQTCIPGHTSLA